MSDKSNKYIKTNESTSTSTSIVQTKTENETSRDKRPTKPKITSIIFFGKKLSLYIKPEDVETYILFKELAQMERTTVSHLAEISAKEYVRRHHPGNPQRPLSKFGVVTKSTKKCDYPKCEELAEYLAFPHSPASKFNVCSGHFKEAVRKNLLKGWKKI